MKKLAALFATLLLLTACQQPAPTNTNTNTDGETTTTDNTDTDAPEVVVISTEDVPSYRLFLIAMEDKGLNGKEIGCGDSVVSVDGQKDKSLDTVEKKLSAAYNELIKLGKDYGESGYSNFLANNSLKLESATIDPNGKATIKFSGSIPLAGVCDHPRIESQLVETALQFPEITALDIFINDQYLQDFLGLKG